MIDHPFPPVWDKHAHILILGTFPSVRSRDVGFFYGHPQNRFWQTLAAVFSDTVPSSIDDKIMFLNRHRIALWDVIASCDIEGSADATIKNVTPNDLSVILNGAPIRHIITNGKTADALYRKHQLPSTGMEAILLPSTSAANARWNQSELARAWSILAVFAEE